MTEYIERKEILDAMAEHHGKRTDVEEKAILDAWDRIKKIPSADVVAIPPEGMGELSDGYHTFNELYHHRAVLFSVICNFTPDKAWKSKLHDTGDMYDGMFIVGIETPQGQATYHYDIDPYWDMFEVQELERAPKWDGHTPEEAIQRIAGLAFLHKRRSTGLTDRNGKEIFEGDIVRDVVRSHHPLEVVKFEGGGFAPFAVPGWECTPEGQDVEIVGNIYDNPELLKGEG